MKTFVIRCNGSVEAVVIGDEQFAGREMHKAREAHRSRLHGGPEAYNRAFYWRVHEYDVIVQPFSDPAVQALATGLASKAMTAEGLHSKSDIAAELAHRDIRIKELEEEVAGLQMGQPPTLVVEHESEYTEAIGEAGENYLCSKSLNGYRSSLGLPATFRWSELWDAMRAAAERG